MEVLNSHLKNTYKMLSSTQSAYFSKGFIWTIYSSVLMCLNYSPSTRNITMFRLWKSSMTKASQSTISFWRTRLILLSIISLTSSNNIKGATTVIHSKSRAFAFCLLDSDSWNTFPVTVKILCSKPHPKSWNSQWLHRLRSFNNAKCWWRNVFQFWTKSLSSWKIQHLKKELLTLKDA